MTATTSPAATLPNGVTSGQRLRRVLQAMVIGMRPMLGGYWLIMVLSFLGIGLIIQLASDGNDHSIWDYGTQSPKYFSVAIGVTLAPAFFTLMVSLGITRRMFSLGASIFLVGAAAGTALLWVLVYQVEHLIYAWQGWTQTLANPHLFTETSQVGLIFTEFFLLVLSHEVAGWLVGITFLRFGAWKGLALLPLTVLPAAAAELLLVAQWLAEAIASTGYHRPSLAVAVPGVLAVSALGLYFGYLMIRPFGVRPTKG
ncbi:hypothetical protein Kfla_5862 [Kribbella flavida DSM 17836]|uniref:Uncharacterized protein n=1 Tax=Kribbella flavida (strain DSM 17836 / JCM 10339 / NBRC 14399) TaxID=479435 RepID=D2PRE8_KRIFD|nr:hypothetical protein [Kribbella flavida]ADB34866.1 hypothetical protein Kfla_5862 [Kribbella flavida DSM 17836]